SSRIRHAAGIDALVQRVSRARDREEARRAVSGRGPMFVGHGVSAGLRFDVADPDRLAAGKLPILLSAADLASALEITEGQLNWLTYHRGTSRVDHYARFTIPKRSGGVRVIASPKPYLRRAQRWILNEVLERIPVHD